LKTCERCEKRPICTQLCERAKRWVDRDHESIRELTGFDLDRINVAGRWEACQQKAFSTFPYFPFLSKKANRVLPAYCSEGMTRLEISKAFKICLNSVDSILARSRAEIALHSSVINSGVRDDE
jgi:hypothetical protein